MIFTRVALLAMLVACACAFVPATLPSGHVSTRASNLNMVIGLPYKPVFSYEWGMDVSESQKKATADAKAKIAEALPAERVHIGYKDAKSVAIEVVSETFEGKSESQRTSAVMGLVSDFPFSVDELYTVTFMEKFAQGMEKALPNTSVFDKKAVQAKGFSEAQLESKIKEMSKDALSAVSDEVKPVLEGLM